jgi:flagellar M-ring protein FliF
VNTFAETFRNLGPARLGAMVLVLAGIVAFFIFLTTRLANPNMALLYSELDGQDSAQIVARLEQRNLPYRVSADGSQVFVPADQVGSLRVAMAEDGLPSGGSVGYEIFDRSEGLGTTNFVQNINHLRALEGELARTIRSIGQVKAVRVHLVLARRELFSRNQQEPSASIVLTMNGNRRLNPNQIQAVQNLVAAAVPNLQPNLVSIVDNQGTLLARPGDADDLLAGGTTAEEMRHGYESRMARTIEDLIERSVGAGNVRAEISAEMDFDRITENAEIYDPDGQVLRSSQTVEETAN